MIMTGWFMTIFTGVLGRTYWVGLWGKVSLDDKHKQQIVNSNWSFANTTMVQ